MSYFYKSYFYSFLFLLFFCGTKNVFGHKDIHFESTRKQRDISDTQFFLQKLSQNNTTADELRASLEHFPYLQNLISPGEEIKIHEIRSLMKALKGEVDITALPAAAIMIIHYLANTYIGFGILNSLTCSYLGADHVADHIVSANKEVYGALKQGHIIKWKDMNGKMQTSKGEVGQEISNLKDFFLDCAKYGAFWGPKYIKGISNAFHDKDVILNMPDVHDSTYQIRVFDTLIDSLSDQGR